MAQTFVMLVVIALLAVATLWGARKLGVGRPMGAIKLKGRLPLDARKSVYLIQVGSRVLVVGASEAGLTKLAELGIEELPLPAEDETPSSFADILAKARLAAAPRRSQPSSDSDPEGPET